MKEKKNKLRKLIAQKKTEYNDSTLKRFSENIWKQLESEPAFHQAKTILLYYSMKDEVHTHTFIEKWRTEKQVLLPVVKGEVLELRLYTGPEQMKTGAYGISEPEGLPFENHEIIDLIIVPGVSFDLKGYRLGRGKGYYDRLLPSLSGKKIGVCFSFQLVEDIPTETFDIPMDQVISNG